MAFELIDNSIVFSTNQNKLEILSHLSDHSLFLNVHFFDYHDIHTQFSNNYYFYLKQKHHFSLDFSRKLKKYFDYLDVRKIYSSQKLEFLRTLKIELLDEHIITESNISKYTKKLVYSVNDMPVPRFFKPIEIKALDLYSNQDSSVSIIRAGSQMESCYSVYETIVDLLESGAFISSIKILNASKEDEYYLEKLFYDSSIPLSVQHSMLVQNHPKGIELLRVLKESGFEASLDILKQLVKNTKYDALTKPLLRVYNSYNTSDIEQHLDVFIQLVSETSVLQTHYTNCIESLSFDHFVYEEENHYLLMNYVDGSMPRIIQRKEYLNNEELSTIGYCSLEEENHHIRQSSIRQLNRMKHLTLFFPLYSKEENRMSDVALGRKVVIEDYQYIVRDRSYKKSLDQLEFAKAKYDYQNYHLKRPDYDVLFNTYHLEVSPYNHEFTGIHKQTLQQLLKQHNTITGAKIESYHLCQFQFLLKHLLKLEDYEASISQYLGTLSHKVLEAFVLDNAVDYHKIVEQSTDFPLNERFKESIFKSAIKTEMDHLITAVKNFHNQSMFKDITPEKQFRIPFRLHKDYLLTGTIDKVMSYTDSSGISYYALIDYKLSNKDFKIDEFINGRSMQLPVYLYAYKAEHAGNVVPLGFYYQTTTLGRFKRKDSIEKNYQLAGISKEDPILLKKFDPSESNIYSVSYKLNGELKQSKNRLKSSLEFEEINQITEQFINTMIKGLEKGEFAINPVLVKGIGKDSMSCEYCGFYSICYNKNKRLGGEE